MKKFYRIMLGAGSIYAAECFAGGFIGAHLSIDENLAGRLPDEWRAFNHAFIPVWLNAHPDRSKIAAGLACGFLWTIAKGIRVGDIALCPDGSGRYHVGEVIGDYTYAAGESLPHRRAVRWLPNVVDRRDMSEALQNSTGSIGTVCEITKYQTELEQLIGGIPSLSPAIRDPEVQDPVNFALEKHLEDFLVANWAQTELGRDFEVYTDNGERVGQQYPTDTGPMDVLAVSKDKRRLLVVELKKGRASDAVVGQVLRYMGFVQEELAEPGQEVEGVIIALDDDQRVRRALAMVPNVTFYRYEISFKLLKAGERTSGAYER
jgi:restriction system protein